MLENSAAHHANVAPMMLQAPWIYICYDNKHIPTRQNHATRNISFMSNRTPMSTIKPNILFTRTQVFILHLSIVFRDVYRDVKYSYVTENIPIQRLGFLA